MLRHDIIGPKGAPLIVMLHGFGVSRWMWTEQVESLSGDYQCLTIDLPGNGESHSNPWTGLNDASDEVADVIRTYGAKAHVVGHSLGGSVALRLLERHPDICETSMILGVSVRQVMQPALMSAMSAVLSVCLRWRFLGRWSAKAMGLDPEASAAFQRDLTNLSPTTIRKVYRDINVPYVPKLTDDIAASMLLVAGSKEVKAILLTLKDLKTCYPQIRAARLPGQGHVWMLEKQETLTGMIRQWVSTQTPISDLVLEDSGAGGGT